MEKEELNLGEMLKRDMKIKPTGDIVLQGIKDEVKIGVDKELKKQYNKEQGIIEKDHFTYIVKTKQKDGTEKEIEKVSIDKVSDYLIEKYVFKTIYGTKSEKVFLYKEGIYNLKGKETIKTEVEELLKSKATSHIVNEVYEKIKRKTPIDIKEFNFIEEGLVCLENGIYNLKDKKFLKHDSKYYFKSKLPINYNPKADCPNIKKFFEEILYEEDVSLIQEWIGFNLYNRYFEKKAIILFGDKDTGKTITLNLFSNFIGEENKVSLSLQNISFAKSFDLLNLKDKYSNIYDDLGDKDINDTGGFKIATGGSIITGEEKFGDRISFKTFAKLTFATNKIPATKDVDDDAYYDRWMPIPLDNQIPKKNQDKFLLQKLTSKEEISGLFNWAIKGFNRLIKNNGFSFNKTSKEIKNIMQRSSHHLTIFVEDCLEKQEGNRILRNELFNVYSKWCEKNDIARFTKTKLTQNLERFCPYILRERDSDRIWLNANLKGKSDTYDTFSKTYRGKIEDKKNKKYGIYNFSKSDLSDGKKPLKNVTKDDIEDDDKIEEVKIK